MLIAHQHVGLPAGLPARIARAQGRARVLKGPTDFSYGSVLSHAGIATA